MYCPKCARPLADDQKFCRSCGLDLQIVSQILDTESDEGESGELESTGNSHSRSQKSRLRLLGTIILMLALIIGCLIPISIGLLSNWAYLNQLILILAGLAGLPLFGGVILLIYADSLPETLATKSSPRAKNLPKGVTTNQLLSPGDSEPIVDFNERSTDLLKTPVGKGSGKARS